MTYPIDIHTHHMPDIPGRAIENCFPETFQPQPQRWYSVGLHPWYLNNYTWRKDTFRSAFETILRHPQVLAIGEAGIDKLAPIPLELQQEVFYYQAMWAEAIHKPLIIHAVKAIDELIAFRRMLKPSTPWIIHGFRGKTTQADTYLRHDFYLSFGAKYNETTLCHIPLNRLFLETDENPENITSLYERVAGARSLSASALQEAVIANVRRLFFNY